MSAQLAQALKSTLRIDYENDTGPGDEGFWEWWSVIDEATGETLCKCDDEATAKRILEALAAHEAAPQQEPAITVTIDDLDLVQDWAESRLPPGTHKLYAAPQQAQAPAHEVLGTDLIGKLQRIHKALSKMQRTYGEVGSRDVDVAEWNANLFDAMRSVGRVLCELPADVVQQAQAPTQAEVDLNEALLEVDYWKRIAAHLAAPVGYKLVPIREVRKVAAIDSAMSGGLAEGVSDA